MTPERFHSLPVTFMLKRVAIVSSPIPDTIGLIVILMTLIGISKREDGVCSKSGGQDTVFPEILKDA